MEDLRFGMLCATVLAPHMKPGNRPDPRHFMLRQPAEREMTLEETEAMLDALFRPAPAEAAEPAPVRAPA